MQNLLGGFIEETNRDIHLRLTVYGEEFPEIERDYIYHWKLQITGNRDYPDIDELIMEVSFYPEDEAYFHIKEGVPTKRDREIGTLAIQLQAISVSVPIKVEDIDYKPSLTKVRWIFRNINLSKDTLFSSTVEGAISVAFLPKSVANKFKINIEIYPKFINKGLLPRVVRKKLDLIKYFELLNLKGADIQERCIEIVPYDPKFGKPKKDSPDERILKYTYDTKKGELYKGDVRNVSLRADTLSALFRYFVEKSSNEEECTRIIRDAGKFIGRDFLFIFENRVMNGKNANLQDLAYYDSTAGMGKFTIDIRNKWIEVEKSFLTYNTNFTQSGKTACIFLEGYFEGILSGFLEKDLKVREVKCVSRGDSVCRFEIDENAIYIEDLEFVGKDKNIYKFMLSKKETTPIDNSNQVQKEGPLQQ